MKFLIDDAPPAEFRKPPSVRRIEDCARALPDGVLLTIAKVAEKSGMPLLTAQNMSSQISEELWVRQANRKLYGNAKTIKAYREAYDL